MHYKVYDGLHSQTVHHKHCSAFVGYLYILTKFLICAILRYLIWRGAQDCCPLRWL